MLAPAVAQDLVDETEEPQIRRYTVEVIVFRYAQEVAAGSEVFLPDEPEPEELPVDEEILLIEEPEPEVEEEPEPVPDTELVLLEEEEYALDDVMERLELLDAYEPVMHFGWTQATWPREQTEPLPLFRFAIPPDGLNGNMTLYLSRYLHLVVDLQLDAPDTTQDTGTRNMSFNGFSTDYDDAEEPPAPVYYRIQENRIVKNGELRYYDHPKFGVLARVTRVEEEVPEDGELLGYPVE